MKDLLILTLAFSTAILSYLLIENKQTFQVREPIKSHQIDYFLQHDDIKDSVLYINGGYYDRIDYGITLENPPIGVYELGRIEDYLPRTKIFEIRKEDKVKRIVFDNTY